VPSGAAERPGAALARAEWDGPRQETGLGHTGRMTAEVQSTSLPLLAIAYGRLHLEQPLRGLTTAARGVCRILWVLYSGDPKSRMALRLVKSEGDVEGDVVNVAGLSPQDAAEKIRSYSPDGITCFIDESVAWTAEIAELLGLPFYSRLTASRLTDKLEQRTALRAYGLPTPDFWDVDELADPAVLASVVEQVGFPLVIKPRRGVSSQNVAKLASEAELRAALGTATPGRMLVETFIPDPSVSPMPSWTAPYVSVEILASHGDVAALGVTGRTPLANGFLETGQVFPAEVSTQTRQALVDAAADAVRAVGDESGVLHVELKWTDAGPVVIEVNGRPGGGNLRTFIERAVHADPVQLVMRLALGDHLAFDGALDAPTDVGLLLVIHAGPGIRRITAIEGVAEVEAIPGVAQVSQKLVPGDEVDPGLGTLGCVFEVTAFAPDHETARQIRDRALSTIVISGSEEV